MQARFTIYTVAYTVSNGHSGTAVVSLGSQSSRTDSPLETRLRQEYINRHLQPELGVDTGLIVGKFTNTGFQSQKQGIIYRD